MLIIKEIQLIMMLLGMENTVFLDQNKSKKKDPSKLQNRLNLKMINEYEEKKAFSLVSSINNTRKDLNEPINLRAMENHPALNKESPLGVWDEQDLKFLMQQNKFMKGYNLDNLMVDGGTA